MNNGLEKFRELVLTDKEFQTKLKNSLKVYNGEQTEEDVFNTVLVPLAAEYGITATYEEFHTYIEELANDQELNTDEIAQISGGKGACVFVGGSNKVEAKDEYLHTYACAYIGVGM